MIWLSAISAFQIFSYSLQPFNNRILTFNQTHILHKALQLRNLALRQVFELEAAPPDLFRAITFFPDNLDVRYCFGLYIIHVKAKVRFKNIQSIYYVGPLFIPNIMKGQSASADINDLSRPSRGRIQDRKYRILYFKAFIFSSLRKSLIHILDSYTLLSSLKEPLYLTRSWRIIRATSYDPEN